jgi:hypothetical protein
MVTDPTPLTLTNLGRLAEWCDVVLTEGTARFNGGPRRALRDEWRDVLGLERPHLRVVTVDLGTVVPSRRQIVQRSSAAPVLATEPDDRWVLLLDADEFLDADAVSELLADGAPSRPVRLGLSLRYGAVDRVAPRTHCCWFGSLPDLRAGGGRRRAVGAPLLARAGALRGRSPHHVRFTTTIIDRHRSFGSHATMTEPADQVIRKLVDTHHVWHPRVLDEQHLTTVLSAGVHHAGWWITDHDEPEPWLGELARATGLRVAGPPAPDGHLRALRAWAEARLDPTIPDDLVRAGDDYVARRPHDAVDVLGDLDVWLLSRPVAHTGHLDDRSARH